jgi:hypothetical protein
MSLLYLPQEKFSLIGFQQVIPGTNKSATYRNTYRTLTHYVAEYEKPFKSEKVQRVGQC